MGQEHTGSEFFWGHLKSLVYKTPVATTEDQWRPRTSELYDLFTIMSDISDFMDFSPTRQSKVAACEKLRDTVHSISAMHSSISEGARTPTKKNSFLELYQMTSFDLAKKKDELVSELKTLPPCTRDDCKEHKIPPIVEDSNVSESTLDKTNHNVKKKNKIKSERIELRNPRRNLFFRKRRLGPSLPFLPRTR
ncbi:hypothetical protein TNCV_1358441 [Trichonephila clavipes]|uniref:Uncharacterized protein n=1 Tax=Trichonephila clavipes TaxID=2585209 RepID=A0A8X6SBR0_TRICX|nr:hypothetical protein TNCV_1358441 [Trichonephila clavipes]